jgi:hypothetical protein
VSNWTPPAPHPFGYDFAVPPRPAAVRALECREGDITRRVYKRQAFSDSVVVRRELLDLEEMMKEQLISSLHDDVVIGHYSFTDSEGRRLFVDPDSARDLKVESRRDDSTGATVIIPPERLSSPHQLRRSIVFPSVVMSWSICRTSGPILAGLPS